MEEEKKIEFIKLVEKHYGIVIAKKDEDYDLSRGPLHFSHYFNFKDDKRHSMIYIVKYYDHYDFKYLRHFNLGLKERNSFSIELRFDCIENIDDLNEFFNAADKIDNITTLKKVKRYRVIYGHDLRNLEETKVFILLEKAEEVANQLRAAYPFAQVVED